MTGLWGIVAFPILHTAVEQRSEIESKRELLGKLQAAIAAAQKPTPLPAEGPNPTALLIAGDNDATRGANLQIAMSQVTAEQGLRLRSSRVLQPQTMGQVQTILLEANVEATLDQLMTLLSSLTAHKPILSVTAIRLMASPVAAGAQAADAKLDVQLEVAALAGVVP